MKIFLFSLSLVLAALLSVQAFSSPFAEVSEAEADSLVGGAVALACGYYNDVTGCDSVPTDPCPAGLPDTFVKSSDNDTTGKRADKFKCDATNDKCGQRYTLKRGSCNQSAEPVDGMGD